MIEEIYQGGAYNKHNTDDDPECYFCRCDERENDIHSKKSSNKGQRKYYRRQQCEDFHNLICLVSLHRVKS